MDAVYVGVGIAVFAIAFFVVRIRVGDRGRRSITRYHHALEVLGEMAEHHDAGAPAASSEPVDVATQRTGPPHEEAVVSDSPKNLRPLETSADTGSSPRPIFEDHPSSVQPGVRSGGTSGLSRSVRTTPFLHRIGVLRIAFVIVAVLAAGAIAAIVATGSSGPAARPPRTHGSARPKRRLIPPASGGAVSSSSSTTTSTTTLSARGQPPRLLAIEPDTGAPGETLTLVGSGIESPNGRVVAYFGDEPAPTSCPTEARCTVTVPTAAHGTVAVRIETEFGRSNAITFRAR